MVPHIDWHIKSLALFVLLPHIVREFFFEVEGSLRYIDFELLEYLDSVHHRVWSLHCSLDIESGSEYFLDTLRF